MRTVILYFLLAGFGKLAAQTGDLVFTESIVHVIDIETDIPNWFDTLELDYRLNNQYPDSFPEIYRACDVRFDGILVPGCGFRQKGNFSNVANAGKRKKPFKIAFDAFEEQRLDGLKKINLNNFTNDPSLLHEAISYKILRDIGVPAPRTSFAKLIVNGEYIGLYEVVENVDKTFLKLHFGGNNNEGNLYKTNRRSGVFLHWSGDSYQGYAEQGLKLTTNESDTAWTQLIDFVDILNRYEGPDFQKKLDSVFDVPTYLRVLAVEKLVRSWDSYWGGGNNFYLYEHPDGKMRWIPWDMNETFQDIKVLQFTHVLDGYLVPTNRFDTHPLLDKIFAFDDWKQDYLDFACELQNGIFSVDSLGPWLVRTHQMIDQAYREDPNKWNSYASFQSSLSESYEDELSIGKSGYSITFTYPGIFPFINQQKKWLDDQLKGWESPCSTTLPGRYHLLFYPNPANDQVTIINGNGHFDYSNVIIRNTMGQLVYNHGFQVFETEKTDIDISRLLPGIYFLEKRHSNGYVGIGKLVVR